MNFIKTYESSVYNINETSFDEFALQAFDYQYNQCELYKDYSNYLKKTPKNVKKIEEIPFLPIEFFKSHVIKSGEWATEKVFKSSGTTSSNRSNHHVKSVDFYHQNTKKIFENTFGNLSDYVLIALLPSYQQQGDSSLISMVDFFMNFTKKESGYFLEETLPTHIEAENLLLIGVSYALLDCSPIKIISKNPVIMETGGMKGRKKEMTRLELHTALKNKFGQAKIWSEYGMTELLSQAYGENGTFCFPNWADVLVREVEDPLCYVKNGKTGGMNIIDLANIHTCCFIETKDLGKKSENNFQIIGRFDNSDIRGCNLMI